MTKIALKNVDKLDIDKKRTLILFDQEDIFDYLI